MKQASGYVVRRDYSSTVKCEVLLTYFNRKYLDSLNENLQYFWE